MRDPSYGFRWLLLVTSVVTFSFLVAAVVEENYLADWLVLQRQYRSILEQKATDEIGRALRESFRIELRQVSVPALRVVDRCVTCHLGIDDPRMTDVAIPFAVHPGDILKNHPADRFGCTICHRGQGAATTTRDAAHRPLEFWDEPMLRGEYVQASCAQCHRESAPPQAPLLAAGRRLYTEEFACDVCHRIGSEGGTDGPDLTYVGTKSLRTFDFARVQGERSRAQWLFEHFKDPQAIVPDSEMPNVEMDDDQARALTAFMLSLVKGDLPERYVVRSSSPAAQRAAAGSLFEAKGCLLCHPFEGQGGLRGPDLANLSSQRNADWLFRHFKDPRPTVPGTRILPVQLSDAEANELTRTILSVQ